MPSNSLFRRKKGTFPAAASAMVLAVLFVLSTLPALSGDGRRVGFNGEAILQPGLPLEIVDVTAHMNTVTKELALNYTIANHSSEHVRGIGLQVLLFDGKGNTRGGQEVRETLDLPPASEVRRELRLSNIHYFNPVRSHRSAVVAITGWWSERAAWSLDVSFADLARAMERRQPLSGSFSIAQSSEGACASDFCAICDERAGTRCGGRIKSYSCEVGKDKCVCSYQCKDDALEIDDGVVSRNQFPGLNQAIALLPSGVVRWERNEPAGCRRSSF